MKRILSFLLALTMAGLLSVAPASAKTISSARADNIFFYAMNAQGKSVLLKVMGLDALKALAHGQSSGKDYYISSTDNYPTTQYCEARGFTVPELIDYIKSVTTVKDASKISFAGGDKIQLMATDSYGNYSRAWTYDQLYGVKRYYFEGLYDKNSGWNTGWEVAGEDNSKFGITLDEYNRIYKNSDPYYRNKRTVFGGGLEAKAILATESYSGRTKSATLLSSEEPGISEYIKANGGMVAGCLKDALTDEYALRLALPMTEADLMAAHRTAYDNFKWVYNMRLDMTDAPAIQSLGTVEKPVPTFTKSTDGKKLTIAFSCSTSGAAIYYSFDGAPQIKYTGPISYDITGRDLSSNPVTVYATAVKEGWDDAGVQSFKYPGMAPGFQTLYSGMAGKDLTFTAAEGVSSADWTAWTSSISSVSLKAPSANGYVAVDKTKYSIDNTAKTVTFSSVLFPETGFYSFIFYAPQYANKNVSVTMKKAAPTITAAKGYVYGQPISLSFDDTGYQTGLSVYVTPSGGSRTMISSSYLDRTQAGRVTIKADYFSLDSSVIPGPGTYMLELDNNNYSPSSQSVEITVSGDFADVKKTAWYYDAVEYVMKNGLFDATKTGFSPDAPMTRRMLAEALYRLSGSPAVTNKSPFHDCDAASVTWAYGAGVVNGTSAATFEPEAGITREQIAAMFYRYAKYLGGDTTAAGDTGKFTDAAQISGWAAESMRWAVGNKLINGLGNGKVAPQGTATRAQVAQILLNYANLGGKKS